MVSVIRLFLFPVHFLNFSLGSTDILREIYSFALGNHSILNQNTHELVLQMVVSAMCMCHLLLMSLDLHQGFHSESAAILLTAAHLVAQHRYPQMTLWSCTVIIMYIIY